jgi:aryl-alcohol dehydrogenase-like predicted oxidoreductase
MEYRDFGKTGLRVSVIGFGGWAIGGSAMAGGTAVGWGQADDATSRAALRRAADEGITFYDTADFYGFGRSESLIGEVFGNSDRVVVATKVGHRLKDDGTIALDYSARYIRSACEQSLQRLKREAIDLYQLHSARLQHFEEGECLEEMDRLRQRGMVRHWGLSLNSFTPAPEAEFLLERHLGQGFQLVLNLLNRRSLPVIERAREQGVGVIVRMALQFGLLAGSMEPDRIFANDDHRSFRLSDEIIGRTRTVLRVAWEESARLGWTPAQLALRYAAAIPGVSTVIPGIRTPDQATTNANAVAGEANRVLELANSLPAEECEEIVRMMQSRG